MDKALAQLGLDLSLVEREFPPVHETVYLNTGSAGRKPKSVLDAISSGWARLNDNPTLTTFLDPEPLESARTAIADSLLVPARNVLLLQNPTQGLQMAMQSFLLKPGDELITTTHEHTSVYAIARYLEETRGIIVRKFPVQPHAGSDAMCLGVFDLVTPRTKLVIVSEVSCATGWRPDLSTLVESLSLMDVPLVVDGAHSTGQINSKPSMFPMWLGSGHKWLGGPNGTGFAYVSPDLVSRLEPVLVGDKYFERKDADNEDLRRLESHGTADVVKWLGLKAAFDLFHELGPSEIFDYQNQLVDYLRMRLHETVKPLYRTPHEVDSRGRTALVGFYFDPERLLVNDLSETLWTKHKICVRNDFTGPEPRAGVRVSCHYSVTRSDIDKLVDALSQMVKND